MEGLVEGGEEAECIQVHCASIGSNIWKAWVKARSRRRSASVVLASSTGSACLAWVGGRLDTMLILLSLFWMVSCFFYLARLLPDITRPSHDLQAGTGLHVTPHSHHHRLCAVLIARISSYFRLTFATNLLRSSSIATSGSMSIFVLMSILSPSKKLFTATAPGAFTIRPM